MDWRGDSGLSPVTTSHEDVNKCSGILWSLVRAEGSWERLPSLEKVHAGPPRAIRGTGGNRAPRGMGGGKGMVVEEHGEECVS